METKNIYQSPIVLAFGFKVDQMARGILTISQGGRVEIKLNDGTLLLSAPIKACTLAFSIDNSWRLKVDKRAISIITLRAPDEKVRQVGNLRYRRWAHEDGTNIEPDKTMENLFRNTDKFPEDPTPPTVLKGYEPIPGLRKTTYEVIITGGVGLVSIFVLAFLGLTSPPIVSKPTQAVILVIILLITSLRISQLYKRLNTPTKR